MSRDVEEATLTDRPNRALRDAFRAAADAHGRAGVPMVIWRGGRPVEIAADDLLKELDEDTEEACLRSGPFSFR